MTGAALLAHTGVVDHVALVAVVVALGALHTWAWVVASADEGRGRRADGVGGLVRPAAWAGGSAVVLVALSPPLESVAERSFTGHMVQHLLLIAVAAPLLTWAAPVATVRRALRRRGRRARVTPRERDVARRWAGAAPIVAAGLFVATLLVTHLTGIYDLALRSAPVHHLEHAAYLGSAVLLWSVVGASSRVDAVGRIGTVFGVIAGSALLGIVLLSASAPLIDTYAARLGPDGALDDQRAAASLMWVGGMATSLPLLLLAFWRWASAEERVAARSEALRGDSARAVRDEVVGRSATGGRSAP